MVLELSPEDDKEEKCVTAFYATDCCEKRCNRKIPREIVIAMRQSCMELSKAELDMLVKGHLDCLRQDPALVHTSKSERATQMSVGKEKHRLTTHFPFWQITICQKMYFFVHNLGTKMYANVVKDFDDNGIGPQIHGLSDRTPTCSGLYTQADIEGVIKFLHTFAEKHAIPLPGRLPNYKDYSIMKLPLVFTKRSYVETCATEDKTPMHLIRFLVYWR
jgi:hypothetical protein